MAISLRRDSQQWIFDEVVGRTGKVFHFQGDGRGALPPSVRQHDMISKHLGRQAMALRHVADEEAAAGHRHTALQLYFDVAAQFSAAQHTVFAVNEEKSFLHGAAVAAYEKVRELSESRIESVRVEADGKPVFGNFHHAGIEGPAPCVIFIPGCDMTKEIYPHPLFNHASQRGMHLLSVDGPGQGESTMNGNLLSPGAHARAITAFIDELVTRPEVDASKIGIYGMSFASRWALEAAAGDDRIAACAAPSASICDMRHLLETESPRYKQLFAFLTGASSEEELDELTGLMGVEDRMSQVRCPTLLTIGEFDPRSPLAEVVEMYEKMTCPRELLIHEDQHHNVSPTGRSSKAGTPVWMFEVHGSIFDWIGDRFRGLELPADTTPRYVRPPAPTGPRTVLGSSWLEAYGVTAASAPRGAR